MSLHTTFQQNILRYWRILELFEPQKIPQITLSKTEYVRIEDITENQHLPWVNPEEVPQNPRDSQQIFEWAYYVYVGIFPQSLIFDELSEGISEDEKEEKRPYPHEETAIATLQVDHRGRLVLGSVQLTTALWALYRKELLTTNHELSLAETNKLLNEYVIHVEAERVRKMKGLTRADQSITDKDLLEEQLPVDRAFLSDLHAICLRAQKSPKTVNGKLSDSAEQNLRQPNMRYKRTRIRVDPKAPAIDIDSDHLLGSFHIEELDRAIIDVGRGELSTPLNRYLSDDSQLKNIKRYDLRQNPQILVDGVHPTQMALGRWPSHPTHHLALSQQFTVNKVRRSHQFENLLGVNGPPGTGKTTLLRDVYADLMVERANRLARLKSPRDGFTGTVSITLKGKELKLSVLAPQLRGFEMVVVSANNTAVENISMELPQQEAISSEFSHSHFFAEQASKVLTNSQSKTGAWGMAAARLGNRGNCRTFVSNYWYKSLKTDAVPMHDMLKETEITRTWAQAVSDFNAKLETVRKLINSAKVAEFRLKKLQDVRQQGNLLRLELETARANFEALLPQEKQLNDNVLGLGQEKKRLEDRCESYQAAKPGFWENLFSFGKSYQQWFAGYQEKQEELAGLDAAHAKIAQKLAQIQQRKAKAISDQQQIEKALREQNHAQQQLEQQIAADRHYYGKNHPNHSDSGEVNTPWLTDELDRARSELFLEAMNLHQDFILHNRGKFKSLLGDACDLLQGKDTKEEAIPELWAAFFMAVPLVSSTFASVSKLFTGMKKGSIGWVIVDEAGQAKPQQAVGAFQLASNALVVGDPLQLQPVVTLPESVSQQFAREMGIASEWTAPDGSVQSLTDRVSAHGTMLGHDEEKRWVSSPLRAHRRCEDPMFTISNTIAYDGAMIHCVSHPEDQRFLIPASQSHNEPEINKELMSQWLHCGASDDTQKIQQGEIDRLRALLDTLNASGIPDAEVMVISPYKKIANYLVKFGKSRGAGLQAGTIHTTQGKEATAVIIVLGTGKKSSRSRSWAAKSPHLLNVAVSRAKRRLYVIGDQNNWSGLPYFSDLSVMLSNNVQGKI